MEAQRAPTIVSIATKYGLILGVLSFVLFFVEALAGLKQSWVPTVLNTALIVVLMVLAHQEFKRSHDGMMTYAQGLGSGTLLGIIAAVLDSLLVYVYVKYINTGYIAGMLQIQRAAIEQRGIKGPQADQAMAMVSMLMTPVGIVISSLIGGVIGGFIVALIVSIFTQKRDPRAVI